MDRQRVRLTGGLEHTVTWVEVLPDGSLLVELYDHSQEAEQWFGNDLAFLLKLEAKDSALSPAKPKYPTK